MFSKLNKESPAYIIIFITIICFLSALIIASASISLQPKQREQIELNYQRNVLNVSGISYANDKEVIEKFKNNVKTFYIDRATGKVVNFKGNYNLNDILNDNSLSTALNKEQDVAGIRRVANINQIFATVNDAGDKIEKIVLPIYGVGLWSTLYAFVAVNTDGNTISGIVYYKQGETPGLGAEISNPRWSGQFKDKKLYIDNKLALSVVKGATGSNQIDSVSGATLTSAGVNNSIKFWFGDLGYEKFLKLITQQGADRVLLNN